MSVTHRPFATAFGGREDAGFVPKSHNVTIGEVGELTDAMLAALESDELPRLRVAIEQALHMTRKQLKQARREKAQTGRGWDREWYRRAMEAEVTFGRQIVLVQAEMTRRKGGTKTERNAALQREFVNVARDMLSPEVFRDWLDLAARRLRTSGERQDDAPTRPASRGEIGAQQTCGTDGSISPRGGSGQTSGSSGTANAAAPSPPAEARESRGSISPAAKESGSR